MPVTDSQFRFLMIGVIFIALWGVFNALYIGSQLHDVKSIEITDLVKASWAVFTQPELLFLNVVLGATSLIGGGIILASYLRG